jgi:hypothetical protein
MRRSKIRSLTLVICATAVVVPLLTATDVAASGRHIRKHHERTSHGWSEWAYREVRPAAPSYSPGSVCPGISRGIDCRIWPPPFDEDADRNSGDGGGG